MHFQVKHMFNCTSKRFWDVFFDADFNERLWAEAMRASRYEMLNESIEESGARARHFRVVLPQLELPGPIATLINPEFGYAERGTYSPSHDRYSFQQVLTVLSDRITLSGAVRTEPQNGGIARIGELHVAVRLPIIGKLGERAAESNLRKAWDESARFTASWLRADSAD